MIDDGWLIDGPTDGARLLLLPPLFDEANRMRRTLRQVMRRLAIAGVRSLLPDWPGQNESTLAPADVTVADLKGAVGRAAAACAGRPFLCASVRGAAAFDHLAAGAAGWWRLAPAPPSVQLRAMARADALAMREAAPGRAPDPDTLAGWPIATALRDALDALHPTPVAPLRTRAAGDLGGPPLWLRAEPGEDAALVDAMARDITDWMLRCDVI